MYEALRDFNQYWQFLFVLGRATLAHSTYFLGFSSRQITELCHLARVVSELVGTFNVRSVSKSAAQLENSRVVASFDRDQN